MIRILALVLVFGLTAACSIKEPIKNPTVSYEYETEVKILTLDERQLVYNIDKPKSSDKIPLLFVIDGSGCAGQKREAPLRTLFRPGPERPALYARISVEKPGVDPFADNDAKCSNDFLKHYTMDKRVEDHLRVLQHIRNKTDWWNGELLIWGWSDGGDIGSRLMAYYPNTKKAVLGSFGGGDTMREMFETYFFCQPEELEAKPPETREQCLKGHRDRFQGMIDNPSWKETWGGKDNSWRVWSSRLNVRNSVLLENNKTPVLFIHGAEDVEPLASSRKLIKNLEAVDNTAYTNWEVKGMGHSFGKMPDARLKAFERAQLNWIFDQPIGLGGPPDFGVDLEIKTK